MTYPRFTPGLTERHLPIMATHIDLESLMKALECLDVYSAIHADEPVINVVCMECDALVLRARDGEISASNLVTIAMEHDCEEPADVVEVDETSDLVEAIDGMVTISSVDETDPLPEETAVSSSFPPRVLCLSDRCDQCSAQAWVRVYFAEGVLDFCSHHYNDHALTLAAAGHRLITDERKFINVKPNS